MKKTKSGASHVQNYSDKGTRRAVRAFGSRYEKEESRRKRGLRPLVFGPGPEQTRVTGSLKRSERRGTDRYCCR